MTHNLHLILAGSCGYLDSLCCFLTTAEKLFLQICEDIFWQNYKKFREEEQKMMEAEVAKMQQAMAIQQTGGLPMPWDGASPPAGRVSTKSKVLSHK